MNDRDHRLRALTPRELEVLALMADGRSNVGISDALEVSPKTVEAHVRSIFVKLGLPPESEQRQHRRVQAVLTYLHARPDGQPVSQRDDLARGTLPGRASSPREARRR